MDTTLRLFPTLHPDCDPRKLALGAGVLMARMAPLSNFKLEQPPAQAVLEWMIDHDLITARQASRCQEAEDPLAQVVSSGLASRWTVALASARLAGRTCIELNPNDVDTELVHAIPEHLARRYQILPLEQEGQSLRLAMADPSNVMAIDDVRLITGWDVEPIQASVDSIQRACERTFGAAQPSTVVEGTSCSLRSMSIQTRLCGRAAEVTIEQTFVNPLEDETDVVYSCPLPPGAAVFGLTVRTGGRTLRGATRTLEGGVSSPARAASETSFSIPLGRLGCGQEMSICLTYAERLEVVDGDMVWRLPMTWEPRFGSRPKALRIQTVLETGGVPPARIECSQPVGMWQGDGGSTYIELWPEAELSDRDFVLRYRLPAPKSGVALDVDGKHFMLTLNPSFSGLDTVPHDVVILLDISRPMQPRLAEACRAVARYLGLLRSDDRFRLLCVADVVQGWSEGRWCGAEQVEGALFWLRQREAAGGLELYQVVEDLMSMPVFDQRHTSVILVTMGPAHHEAAVAKLVRDSTRPMSFFTFALDEQGNHDFLREVADVGRGAFQYAPPGQLETAMARLWDDTRRPEVHRVGFGLMPDNPTASTCMSLAVLQSVEVETSSISPPRIADVYHARPAVTFGRYAGSGRLSLTGRTVSGTDWAVDVESRRTRNRALGVLWARSRCRDLGDTRGADVEALAVQYNLVTPATAFVLSDTAGRVIGTTVMPPRPVRTEPLVPSLAKVPERSPIVVLVNALLRGAMDEKAIQVHLVPGPDSIRCLFRMGDYLRETPPPPRHLYEAVVARLKQMAEMDQGPARKPLQGSFPVRNADLKSRIELRILPTSHGEAVTLHLQTTPALPAPLRELGLNGETCARIQRGLARDRGLTLIAGPYDAGVILAYAAVGELQCQALRVVTLEASIQERLPGASQVSVLVFPAAGVDDVLAQDPDVLVVTVPVTELMLPRLLLAAETRRVIVVSKTSDATTEVLHWVRRPEARCVLRLIISGHSISTLCSHCRQPHSPPPDVRLGLSLPDSFKSFRGHGCLACSLSGQRVQVGWHALVVEDAVRQALAPIRVRTEMRHLLAPEWMDIARERLQKGDIDCGTYRQVLNGMA